MQSTDRRTFLLSSMALAGGPAASWAFDEKPKAASTFHIGLSESLIAGQMTRSVGLVFAQSMSDIFAVPGQPRATMHIEKADELAKRLHQNQLQLAVLTGVEYGWLGQAAQPLVPLVTAFTSDIRLKACLLVHADTKVKNLLELQNKTIALPRRSQFHTLVFLHDAITKQGGQPVGFFDRALESGDVNDGIERVVDKEASVVLVDYESWKTYQERMPGRSRKLSMLVHSPAFPTAAVLYHPEHWKPDALQRMKDVLLTANEKNFTRQILNVWRISKFVAHSAEYDGVVKEIVREIPQTIVPADFSRD